MNCSSQVHFLSPQFSIDYPSPPFHELMLKQGRPYNCLLVDTHDDYFICVPYRSHISHKNAFMFKGTNRSKANNSGLDYSKIVLVEKTNKNGYIDFSTTAIVDKDEYNQTASNLSKIVFQVIRYVDEYIAHQNGTNPLHIREFNRRYKYSTLPYFHNIMGIE